MPVGATLPRAGRPVGALRQLLPVAPTSATVAAGAAAEAQRSGSSAKAARTREEIELVFDKNKSAIYSLYSRALRENPALQGKVVLEFCATLTTVKSLVRKA